MERSRKNGVPEKDYSDMPEVFSHVLPKSLGDYMKAQFRYWSEDEIACNFRKMLTLEQYKSPEMNSLYQKVFVSGPLEYIENLFYEMSKEQEIPMPSPHALALEFYAPFYLYLSMSDGVDCKETKEKLPKAICVISTISFKDIFAKTERRKEVIVNNLDNMKKYGFSELFSSKILGNSHLEPARVLSQEKGFYRIITEKASCIL